MMKKNLSTFFIALLAVVSLRGAEMPVERLFVSTDREAYMATMCGVLFSALTGKGSDHLRVLSPTLS